MLDAARVVAFVAVTDLDRAAIFYRDVLGLTLDDQRPFALTATVGGTVVRITKVDELRPAPYTVLGFDVDGLAAAIEDLATRGVQFTRYEGIDQDEHGVWTSPNGARVAWFVDPEGNNLSLTEHS